MAYYIKQEIKDWLLAKYENKPCVYCRTPMKNYLHKPGFIGDRATIEHLHYNGPDNWGEIKNGIKLSKENLVMCCARCNSAERKNKKLSDWFGEPYCRENNINAETITDETVRNFLKEYPDK